MTKKVTIYTSEGRKNMKAFLIQNKYWLLVCLISLSVAISSLIWGIYTYQTKTICEVCDDTVSLESIEELKETSENTEEVKPETFFVEIKGAITKPGVYEANENMLINDIISLAGGLKKNSYTDNINLSKKVTKEMVIYIYTKYEYQKLTTKITEPLKKEEVIKDCTTTTYSTSNCIENGSSTIIPGTSNTSFETSKDNENKKEENNEPSPININTATTKDFMNLPGIGESKAKTIITYREENGPFQNIEDIKNVSGIGDKLYEQIKNYLTI